LNDQIAAIKLAHQTHLDSLKAQWDRETQAAIQRLLDEKREVINAKE